MKTSVRLVVVAVVLMPAGVACTASAKTNVLFIAVDDMNNDLGCFEESARVPLIVSVV